MAIAILGLTLAIPPAGAGETMALGIIPGPIGSGSNQGAYVDLVVTLEVTEGASRFNISRNLPRLRDAVMLSLHNKPLKYRPNGGGLDLEAAGENALEAVGRVLGRRTVERVSIERLKIEDFCGSRPSVKSWRKKCY